MSSSPAAFISHSRDDSPFVLRLAEDLKAAGVRTWRSHIWDPNDAGGNFDDIPVMMVVVTSATASARNVDEEVAVFQHHGKKIINLLCGDAALPPHLEWIQAIDFRADYALGLHALLRALGFAQSPPRTNPARPEKLTPQDTAPAAATEAPEVFISYCTRLERDVDAAKTIQIHLESHGMPCWRAPGSVRPGMPYDEEIMQGIHDSRMILLIFSAAANESSHVKREIQHAADADKIIVPIRLKGVKPGKKLQFYLVGLQWFDALGAPVADHLDALAERVRDILNS